MDRRSRPHQHKREGGMNPTLSVVSPIVEAKPIEPLGLPAVIPQPPLEKLVAEIKAEHSTQQYGAAANAARAVALGEKLMALKAELEARGLKGKWTAIVEG